MNDISFPKNAVLKLVLINGVLWLPYYYHHDRIFGSIIASLVSSVYIYTTHGQYNVYLEPLIRGGFIKTEEDDFKNDCIIDGYIL